MQPKTVAGAGMVGVLVALAGCGGSGPSSRGGSSLAPSDPTPLTKCKVALSQESPLVTEWPASEKARLESLASRQVVAVEYSGCEMKIIDGCRLPGSYGITAGTAAWYFLFSDWERFRTTTATTTTPKPAGPQIVFGPGGIGGVF